MILEQVLDFLRSICSLWFLSGFYMDSTEEQLETA